MTIDWLLPKPNGGIESVYYGRKSGLDISADGQFVQFALGADLTPEDLTGSHVFVAKSGMPEEVPGPKLATAILASANTTDWQTVQLPYSYDSMVVVATPVYTLSSAPMVVRIRNATGNRFEINLDRRDGSDDPITDVMVHYLVVEEGEYTQEEHGVNMAAVKFESTVTTAKKTWSSESRSYANSYSMPVILGQVMSANDAEPSVFWSHGSKQTSPASATVLNVGKHVGEDPLMIRANETVGYVVLEAGSGVINGYSYVAGLGTDTVRGVQNGAKQYTHGAGGVPASAVAGLAAMDGGDGGWAVMMGAPNETTISLGIDEDQLTDGERKHTTEQVSYVVFEMQSE